MGELISYILPASFGILILSKSVNKKDERELIILSLISILLTNITLFVLYTYVMKIDQFVSTFSFMMKYILISIPVSICISFIMIYIKNRYSISVEVNNEKSSKKNK